MNTYANFKKWLELNSNTKINETQRPAIGKKPMNKRKFFVESSEDDSCEDEISEDESSEDESSEDESSVEQNSEAEIQEVGVAPPTPTSPCAASERPKRRAAAAVALEKLAPYRCAR